MKNVNNSKATFHDNSGSLAEGNRAVVASGECGGVDGGFKAKFALPRPGKVLLFLRV